ncbi:MAG: GspH/FimT family protein [bacterium]
MDRKHILQRGFTLVELLIVVVIMVVIGTAGIVKLLRTHRVNALKVEANHIVAELRLTINRAEAQENSSQWGIHFENPGGGDDFYQVWYGSDYTSGIKEELIYLPATVVFSGDLVTSGSSKDIVFEKATGLPTTAETITIQSMGSSNIIAISINSYGKIDF